MHDEIPEGMELHELAFTPLQFDAMFALCTEIADTVTMHMADGIRAGVPYHVILTKEMEVMSKYVAMLQLQADSAVSAHFGVMMMMLTGMYSHAVDQVARDGN